MTLVMSRKLYEQVRHLYYSHSTEGLEEAIVHILSKRIHMPSEVLVYDLSAVYDPMLIDYCLEFLKKQGRITIKYGIITWTGEDHAR